MKSRALILGSAMLLLSGTLACAQQKPHMQYDSLGSPTPRPNQETSPNQAEPNMPVPAGKDAAAPQQPSTTGAAPKDETSGKTANPAAPTRVDTHNGETPSGLTPD